MFRIFADPDTSYNALEAGEIDIANIPPARSEEARSNWGTTVDIVAARLVPLHDQPRRSARRRRGEPPAAPGDLDGDRPRRDQRGGLQRPAHASRQASRLRASPASPRTCVTTAPTTRRRPRRPTTSGWRPATSRRRSRSSSTPMPVTSRWWRSSSTTWRRSASRPRPTRGSPRRTSPSWPTGLRVLPGRVDRRLPDVRQLHVRPVPHRVDRRQQLAGSAIPEFDALVDEAKADDRPRCAARLFQQAEDVLLNQEVGVDPDQLVSGRLRLQPRRPCRASGTGPTA